MSEIAEKIAAAKARADALAADNAKLAADNATLTTVNAGLASDKAALEKQVSDLKAQLAAEQPELPTADDLASLDAIAAPVPAKSNPQS